MKIIVQDDHGREAFSYDTDKDSMCLFPSREEKAVVISAMSEALKFLGLVRPTHEWQR